MNQRRLLRINFKDFDNAVATKHPKIQPVENFKDLGLNPPDCSPRTFFTFWILLQWQLWPMAQITLMTLRSFVESHGLLAGSRWYMRVKPWLKLIQNIALSILRSFCEFYGLLGEKYSNTELSRYLSRSAWSFIVTLKYHNDCHKQDSILKVQNVSHFQPVTYNYNKNKVYQILNRRFCSHINSLLVSAFKEDKLLASKKIYSSWQSKIFNLQQKLNLTSLNISHKDFRFKLDKNFLFDSISLNLVKYLNIEFIQLIQTRGPWATSLTWVTLAFIKDSNNCIWFSFVP